MRLGQIARKYDVSVQDIIDILREYNPDLDTMHPNAKLDQESESVIEGHFGYSIQDSLVTETATQPLENSNTSFEEIKTFDVVLDDTDAEKLNEQLENENISQVISSENEEISNTTPEIITTDKLLELVESDGQSIDLSKITLIKAPKKELNGLKVLGKIDLPEPRKPKSQEVEEKRSKENGKKQNKLSEEEAEKRRLWAKKKKEENDARLEQKRMEKEKQQLKALREAHYKQRIQQNKPKVKKQKISSEAVRPENVEILTKQKPKTILGKFWRWLNT